MLFVPDDYSCIKVVSSFEELAGTRFADGVNALCWRREVPGDFAEVIDELGKGEGIVALEEERLRGLQLGEAGGVAVNEMLVDRARLEELGLEPVLNAVYGGLRDGRGGPVETDVFSWHVDSAPVEVDTWLCTYYGACSEGLRGEEARKKVEVPEVRAQLLRMYGGDDDEGFAEYLAENCYDLHYAAVAEARPWGFGVGNLWRIAAEWPGMEGLPCIHRAPDTEPGERRLLLIS